MKLYGKSEIQMKIKTTTIANGMIQKHRKSFEKESSKDLDIDSIFYPVL